MGADRKALIFQFLGETVLLSLFSVLLAALVAMLLLQPLNQFTGKSISFRPFTEWLPALAIVGGGLLTGLLAGAYPAFYLSGFQPAKVIKGNQPASFGTGKSWLRESLVVVQFSLSALLIICTIVVFRQTGYLHNKDLGFRKDQVVLFRLRGNMSEKLDALKQELKKDPHIISATAGYGFPGDMLAGDEIIVPGKGTFGAKQLMVDHDYASTLGIRFIAGRDFSRDMKTDPDEAFVINESAVRELGFGTPEKAIGQPLQWSKWYGEGDSIKRGRVIGVIKDFHYSSLHEKISTTILQLFPEHYQMAVKVSGDDIRSTINYMQSTWSAFNQEYPFEYKFLDENFNRMYKAEDRLSTLLLIFTIMAIFVGCLGLFGLAAFSAEKRAKEISIRKILGAGITDIVSLLSRRFIALIVVASLVAFPIAWWAMQEWLQHFPYRLSMNAGIFAFALALSLLIAFAAISFQSIKAAVANPVDKLRNE
jgi:putative ABC transport system permease protein